MSDGSGILVTGATGNVGSEVCRHLTAAGATVFGAIRDPNVTRQLHGAEPRVFDFTNSSTWDAALAGVSKVFLVRPPHISKIARDMYPFMSFMADRRVEHVVFLSVQGVENNTIVPHAKVEKAILELGIPYTFIRPSFFMQNLSTTHLPEIRDDDRIFVPAGAGGTNFIDVRDIGEVTAKTLLDDTYKHQAYTVTGVESLTYEEVAARLSEHLGRTVRYEPARMLPFLRYQRSQGRRLSHTLVMYALYSVTRLGKAGVATPTFEELMGRRPRSLDDFISDHRELFVR